MRHPISELARLYRYMKTLQGSYLLGALLLLGSNAFALLIPWLLKLAIESFRSPASDSHAPGYYALLIIGAAMAHGVIRIFSRTTLLHAGRRIEYQIREDLYAKLLTLDLAFFSRERTGDILSRFANDLANVRMLLGFGVLNVINTLILYLAALTLLIRISPQLTLYAVLPYPLMIFLVQRISRQMFKRSKEVQEELAHLTSQAEESISAAAVIRAYCREASQVEAFRTITTRYQSSNLKMAKLRGLMIPVMGSTGGLGTWIVLFIGGSWIIAGRLTLGDFVAFNGYLAMLIWPTVIMGWILNLIQRGAASMGRLNHVFNARPAVAEPDLPAPITQINGSIECRDLSFGYNGEPQLRHISLRIPRGMRLGVVGPLGSGKSTLVRLIARLYQVADGQLFIDGVDINRIPLRQLRNAIGYVPQESFLFSRTISDNIGYGLAGADPAAIEEAAAISRIARDIQQFPADYQTLVGERGVTLSGGQKQRTAIARALLKNPAILILDDPLSAVDAGTEEEILRGLSGYYVDRTVIIVSHRLSALRGCDQIVALDNGAIAEQGTETELLARGGLYAAMYREQQLREEIARF